MTDPGRYMYRFGWLTITADDLSIWRQFPDASFTLLRTPDAEDEFHLGTFDLPGYPQ